MSIEERKIHYQQVANKHGFTLLEECISNRQKVLMQCNKHPMYKTAITLYSLKKRHFCPYCANEKGHTQGRKIPYDIVKKRFPYCWIYLTYNRKRVQKFFTKIKVFVS